LEVLGKKIIAATERLEAIQARFDELYLISLESTGSAESPAAGDRELEEFDRLVESLQSKEHKPTSLWNRIGMWALSAFRT
jgi:hypothetical protein